MPGHFPARGVERSSPRGSTARYPRARGAANQHSDIVTGCAADAEPNSTHPHSNINADAYPISDANGSTSRTDRGDPYGNADSYDCSPASTVTDAGLNPSPAKQAS